MQSRLQVAFLHRPPPPMHTLITQLIINQRLGSMLSSLQMREHPTAEQSPKKKNKKAGLTTKKKKKKKDH